MGYNEYLQWGCLEHFSLHIQCILFQLNADLRTHIITCNIITSSSHYPLSLRAQSLRTAGTGYCKCAINMFIQHPRRRECQRWAHHSVRLPLGTFCHHVAARLFGCGAGGVELERWGRIRPRSGRKCQPLPPYPILPDWSGQSAHLTADRALMASAAANSSS